MLCCRHNARERPAIDFLSPKSNETFNYSIALINGCINNYNYRHGLQLQITNQNGNKNVAIAGDGKFKAGVQLAPGVNQIRFQFCCVSNDISLKYDLRENPEYLLKILYVVCENHDGCFQAPKGADNSIEVACVKINLVIRLVQCMYAEMLAKNGFDRKSFEFVECQPFFSSLSIDEARQWNQNQLWTHHAKEILARENDSQHNYKYFGILACTQCEDGVVRGNAALGIGDVALYGSGTMYSWPLDFDSIEKCFQSETPVDAKQLMNDSNGRNTFGGCYATAVGSICHEIGHIFDLGHTSDGIMGNDIDYVNRMFTFEKCPRDLPRRMVSKCCATANNPDSSETSARRLTSIKKSNAILNQYHSRRKDDLTFLAENCAVLLNYHKWFNHFEKVESEIACDYKEKVISSVLPLALIEIRSRDTGIAMNYYRFDHSDGQFKFTIPHDKIQKNYDLIALDTAGAIKKFNGNEF